MIFFVGEQVKLISVEEFEMTGTDVPVDIGDKGRVINIVHCIDGLAYEVCFPTGHVICMDTMLKSTGMVN